MKIQIDVVRKATHQFTSTIHAHHETIQSLEPQTLNAVIMNAVNTAVDKGYQTIAINWTKTKMYPSPEHRLETVVELRRNVAHNAPITAAYIQTRDFTTGKSRTWAKQLEGIHTITNTIESEGFRIVNSPS